MSIATVVTQGYGTFGNVHLVTTLGFGSYALSSGTDVGVLCFDVSLSAKYNLTTTIDAKYSLGSNVDPTYDLGTSIDVCIS